MISNKNIRWGLISQVLNSGINILLLPFVITNLSSSELGLWYAYIAVGALVLLLDFGFSTTLVRNISYAWNGASTISSKKISKNISGKVNVQLFLDILSIAKKIYLIVSIISFIILIIFGTMYIYKISNEDLSISKSLLPWMFYLIAVVINIYYLYWTPLLKGIGLIRNYYQINIISKFIQLIVTIFLLMLGVGLLGVTIAYLISIILTRILSKKLFIKNVNNQEIKHKSLNMKKSKLNKEVLDSIIPGIFNQAIISISNYLIDKFPVILSSIYFGLTVTSKLGLTIQLLTVFSTLGNVAYNTLLPEMIKFVTKNNLRNAYQLLCKSLSIQFACIVVGTLITIFVGNFALELIDSNTELLSFENILLLSIYLIVFNFQLVCVNFIIILNEFPMIRSYIFTAISMLALSVFLCNEFSFFGLKAIFFSQIFVLLIYNFWKWPLFIADKMDIKLRSFYIQCVSFIKI